MDQSLVDCSSSVITEAGQLRTVRLQVTLLQALGFSCFSSRVLVLLSVWSAGTAQWALSAPRLRKALDTEAAGAAFLKLEKSAQYL